MPTANQAHFQKGLSLGSFSTISLGMLSNPYIVGASWILVLVLIAVNVFIFLKLKSFGDKMLKSAFPGAKNQAEALKNMQKMMAGMGGAMGGRGGMPNMGGMNPADLQAQMRMAMNMMSQMQGGPKGTVPTKKR